MNVLFRDSLIQFMVIGIMTGILGFSCCVLFWIGVPEVKLTNGKQYKKNFDEFV